MPTSIARIREYSLPKDRAPSVIGKLETQSDSNQSNNSFFLVPGRSPEADPDVLESSDMGRDPRFMNGRWPGIAILISVALGAVYVGFTSVWAALALTAVW